jgi:hypothetical protein
LKHFADDIYFFQDSGYNPQISAVIPAAQQYGAKKCNCPFFTMNRAEGSSLKRIH